MTTSPAPPCALRRQGEDARAGLLAAAVPALAGNGYHAAWVDDMVHRRLFARRLLPLSRSPRAHR